MTESRPTFSRILLTRMKYIGDVVLTTPIIRSVRNAHPNAYIAYLGERNAVSLLEHNPYLDEIIPFDFSRPTILEQPRVISHLRQRKFDLTVDFFNNPRSALLTRLSGAGTRVGAHSRSVRGKFYTVQVKDDGKPKTAIQFHNQLIEAMGIVPVSSKTEIFLTDHEMKVAHAVLGQDKREPNKPIICIHPGATWPAKKWIPERFGELANLLVSKLGVQVILLSGPNDGESVNDAVKHLVSDIKILHNLPLRQLAAIIGCCALFVGNDAGPMHIAAAVGTPTIGLFGPGEENIWFPYAVKDGHVALRKDVPCHPCHLDFCNREGEGYMECMKRLATEDVFDAVAKSLQTKSR